MPTPFEPVNYLRALQARWRRVAATVAVAAAVALGISLLLPRKYDATVTLVIQPAGAGGPYPAVMSPVYLEYLRGYEQFVQSDGLLARLIAELRLDADPYRYTAAGLRASVLKVTLVKNTKILKVRARFGDPHRAQEIALGLARLAAQSNSEINSAEAERTVRQIGKELEEARTRVASTQAELEKFRRESWREEFSRQVAQQVERKVEYQGQLAELTITLADKEARLAGLRAEVARLPEKIRVERNGRPSEVVNAARQALLQEAETIAAETAGLRARQKALRAELAGMALPLQRDQAALASLELRRQELERNYDLAQTALTSLSNRANDSRANVAARHEELQIADRGIVPSRPSSPHVLLNVLVAAFLALIASLLYETWAWNLLQEQRDLAALIASSAAGGSRVSVP